MTYPFLSVSPQNSEENVNDDPKQSTSRPKHQAPQQENATNRGMFGESKINQEVSQQEISILNRDSNSAAKFPIMKLPHVSVIQIMTRLITNFLIIKRLTTRTLRNSPKSKREQTDGKFSWTKLIKAL